MNDDKILLSSSIKSLANIPDEFVDDLFDISTKTLVRKGEFFLMAGDIPLYMGFNLDGTFRLYYVDEDGNDLTKGFCTPGRFVVSYTALIQNRPSFFSIEAMEDTQILKFRYSDWMKLIEEDPRWYELTFKLVEAIYIVKEMREKSFLLDDATTRYLNFKNEYPELEPKLKLYQVASFIGITPEALSRIRKKLKN